MKNVFLSGLLVIATMTLAGCVTREQADAKLEAGCLAAAKLLIEEGQTVESVKYSNITTAADFGPKHKTVSITAVESNGYFQEDKDYRCVFLEQMGFMEMSHSADIVQVKVGERALGKVGDEIIGSFQEMSRLSDTVNDAMRAAQ